MNTATKNGFREMLEATLARVANARSRCEMAKIVGEVASGTEFRNIESLIDAVRLIERNSEYDMMSTAEIRALARSRMSK